MLHELNQSECSAPMPHPQKFMNFEKALPHEQVRSEGGIYTQNFI